jgi:hypothetical protein
MHIYGTKNNQTSFEATDFLRRNDRMAALLPTAMRIARLQRDLAACLPPTAGQPDVLGFEQGRLVLGVPSAAFAAKLKQQLPKLQAALQKRDWPVEEIRLKVQMPRVVVTPPEHRPRELSIPETGIQAFEQLAEDLEPSSQNQGLIDALKRLAARRRT